MNVSSAEGCAHPTAAGSRSEGTRPALGDGALRAPLQRAAYVSGATERGGWLAGLDLSEYPSEDDVRRLAL